MSDELRIERAGIISVQVLIEFFNALKAARRAVQHQMRIWDAQIWATARLNQIPVILSEDFGDGTVIEGILTVNLFADGFQVRDWIYEPP